MSTCRVVAIIPARLGSSRFPGKPLLKVRGLPMVEHVRRRALMCRGFVEVFVATCDRDIAAAVEGYGGTCIMTSPAHPAATDRVAEAARSVDCTHVVNVQGDEILVLPSDLERMTQAIVEAPAREAWNAVGPIERIEELADRSIVKCVTSLSGRVLICSRDFAAQGGLLSPGWRPISKVLGILAFQRDFLARYGALSRTPLEMAEALDQNRILEHDVLLQAVEFSRGYGGINEPREVAGVERVLDEDPLQREVLARLRRLNGVTAERVVHG